ncbi:MAG: class III extradiol ring-cleavage dioxygenase [Myxococcota bacterium]
MLPTVFVGHGAGPFPLLNHPHHHGLTRTWTPGTPMWSVMHDPAVRALVVLSAHHESADAAVDVMMDEQPELLFDYGGFPPETYQYSMDNPGSPGIGRRVLQLLDGVGIPARSQLGRGRDHGLFVPMIGLGVSLKRPTLPVISVSLRGPASYRSGLTEDHLALGRALAPLRDEGVLLVGSGNTIHGRCAPAQAKAFSDHLQGLAAEGPAAFERWDEGPHLSVCHPRPEHLVPLLVCAAAAPHATVESIEHVFMGFTANHFIFEG